MRTTMRTVAVLLCVLVGCASGVFNPAISSMIRPYMHRRPGCTAASKPCRIMAVLEGEAVISSEPCSCPGRQACPTDWESNADRVIVRELLTNGNITITVSMMFCGSIQPPRRCSSQEEALQLTGFAHVPTELDFIQCTCSDRQPLMLHRKTSGPEFRVTQTFVCGSHKKRCKRGRNADSCLEVDPLTHDVSYPCKCTSRSTCQQSRHGFRYTCRRPRPV